MTPEQLDAPFVRAAFINAIREEGTKTEACDYLQKQWNETCALRTALKASEARVAGMREAAKGIVRSEAEAWKWRTAKFANVSPLDGDDIAEQISLLTDADADAALAARDKRVREEARTVKPLVWENVNDKGTIQDALGFNSVYRIWLANDGFVSWKAKYTGEWSVVKDFDAAKAAAQADYDARIKSALIEDTQP